MKIAVAELHGLVSRVLSRHFMSPAGAALIASTVVAAERDGSHSHGLQRIPGYLSSLASGWVDGHATPTITPVGTTLLKVDAANGFAQVALDAARPHLRTMLHTHGSAIVCVANSHHFAALWPDIEPFAADGAIALTMVNTRSRIVAWGGTEKVLGTNPMAFACPRQGKPPLIWDQASSIMSQGEVLLAATAGRPLPDHVGVDATGQPTTDADAVLNGGAFLPFGGIKGGSLAFMIEILAAALGGARFGFEDASAQIAGAATSNAGQFLLLIDPARFGTAFSGRVELLLARLLAAGTNRLPADRRYQRRAVAEREGIEVSAEVYAYLLAPAGHDGAGHDGTA